MAKQNRRINIAKREARELRQKLAHHKARADNYEARARTAEGLLGDIVQRLRTLAKHTVLLPTSALASVGRNTTRMPAPPAEIRSFIESARFAEPWMERSELIYLVQMTLEVMEQHAPGFAARCIHIRLYDQSGNVGRQLGVAISREALHMLREPELATRYIADELGHQLARAVNEIAR